MHAEQELQQNPNETNQQTNSRSNNGLTLLFYNPQLVFYLKPENEVLVEQLKPLSDNLNRTFLPAPLTKFTSLDVSRINTSSSVQNMQEILPQLPRVDTLEKIQRNENVMNFLSRPKIKFVEKEALQRSIDCKKVIRNMINTIVRDENLALAAAAKREKKKQREIDSNNRKRMTALYLCTRHLKKEIIKKKELLEKNLIIEIQNEIKNILEEEATRKLKHYSLHQMTNNSVLPKNEIKNIIEEESEKKAKHYNLHQTKCNSILRRLLSVRQHSLLENASTSRNEQFKISKCRHSSTTDDTQKQLEDDSQIEKSLISNSISADPQLSVSKNKSVDCYKFLYEDREHIFIVKPS